VVIGGVLFLPRTAFRGSREKNMRDPMLMGEKMARGRFFALLLFTAVVGCGCSVPILRQDIPVSSNPLGAAIYADGQMMGQTPGTVSLERNRDHLLTLVKVDYRQVDVAVRRQYQSDRVLMRAVQMGVNSGLFFNDPRMGINSGFNAISEQEQSGEAYILVPSVVQVELTPLSGAPAGVVEPSADSPRAERIPVGGSSVALDAPPVGTGLTAKDVVKAGVVAGSAAMATQVKPMQKTWEASSSSKSYVKPDGTMVTEKSRTTVGVSVNPGALPAILDVLFK
jgi:hypothetical protein